MSKFFYHGIEAYPGIMGDAVSLMIKILNEGIIIRNNARNYNDDKYNHVCLYKKNDEYNYNEKFAVIESARMGWIDNSFVFIINPQLEARKATKEETNLVDEWRYDDNISPCDIVGIALPFKIIEEYLNEKDIYDEEEIKDKKELKDFLPKIIDITKQLNIPIYDSSEKDFTDKLDSSIKHFKM